MSDTGRGITILTIPKEFTSKGGKEENGCNRSNKNPYISKKH